MNTNKITLGLASLLLVSATMFTSCKKEKNEEDSDTSSASDNSMATQNYNDLNSMADEALRSGSVSAYKFDNPNSVLSSCATVSFNNAVNYSTDGSDTLTITFGQSGNTAVNCLCNDGRYRRGQVQFVYTGPYRTVGTVITVVPINYYVNDNQVAGSKTITNVAPPSGILMRHTISVNGTIYKANNGGTVTWTSTRTRDWVSGDTTFMWNDDVYNITGSANGTSSAGNSFTSTITSPLVRKFDVNQPSCKRYFVSGKIDHTPSGKATRTIDFGNGTCDNAATVTINGHVYNITLP
jgi:hypothetical protein